MSFLKLKIRQKGIGLLELMLALGLIAILIIMATRYYVSAQQSTRVNQATSDAQAILAALANYTASGSYTDIGDITVASMQNNGLLPSPFANPWGPGYELGTIDNLNDIPIIITNIPDKDCSQFVTVNAASLKDDTDCSTVIAGGYEFHFVGGAEVT